MYGWGSFAGQDYYDLLAQANLQDCDPMDSACVSNNVAKQAAVETTWVQYMSNPNGAPDNLKLTFTPQTQAQVAEFYNPQDMAYGGNVVDTRGIETSNLAPPPPAPVYSSTSTPPKAAALQSAAPVAGSGSPSAASSWNAPAVSAPGSCGVRASGVCIRPSWYVWAAGAGALLFAFGGKR